MAFGRKLAVFTIVGLLRVGTADAAPITSITGDILVSGQFDNYLIYIHDPATFSATTVGTGGTLGDTQLFLFSSTPGVFGLFANDDTASGVLRSTLPLGVASSLTPGLYNLTITAYNNDPTSSGMLIFPDTPFTGVHGPTGPGGAGPLNGFTGGGSTGSYTIALTGAFDSPPPLDPIPEPTSMVLLGTGLLGLAARHRRKRTKK
jgi:hypothetical protein